MFPLFYLLINLVFILGVSGDSEEEFDSVMIAFEVAIVVIVCQLLPAIFMATDFRTLNQLGFIYIIKKLVTGRVDRPRLICYRTGRPT